MDIKSFNLNKQIINYLEHKKIDKFFNVQLKVIPNLIKQKNSFVESPTGTGKTLSFLIPIINNLNFDINKTQAIIISPTRELSIQINNVIKEINKFYNNQIKNLLAIGGYEFSDQERKLNNNPHIIIGTIDRINSLRKKRGHDLTEIKYLIVDEADMTLHFNIMDEILSIYKDINKKSNNISLGFFSASFPIEMQNYIKKNFNIEIKNIIITHKEDNEITSYMVKAFDNNRENEIINLIKSNKFNPYFCLIFCKTNEEVNKVYKILKESGISELSKFTSDLSSRDRKRVLKNINNSQLVYLITTDLMARGMDFKDVSHIINYSLPVDLIYYKHRIGRTNRNGLKGEIYDIYVDGEENKYKDISKKNTNIIFKKF